MPRAFGEREKELLRNKLLSEGKRLLEQFGLQKTTVEDLARAAGISKGAFYLFYPSKEALFFDILEALEGEIRSRLFQAVFQDQRRARDSFRHFLAAFVEFLEREPLVALLGQESLELLVRRLPPEKLVAHSLRDSDYLRDFFVRWRDQGLLADLDPAGFSGALKMFYLLVLQKGLLGSEYEAAKEFYMDMLTSYVVKK